MKRSRLLDSPVKSEAYCLFNALKCLERLRKERSLSGMLREREIERERERETERERERDRERERQRERERDFLIFEKILY